MRKLMSCVMAAVLLAAAAKAHAQAPAAPGAGPTVFLRTDNPRATLQVETQLFWQDLCVTPCGIQVDPGRLYRVGGRSFVPSDPFSVPRERSQVTVEARMGSRGRAIVGTILTLVGLPLAAGGGIMLYTGIHEPNDAYGDPTFAKVALTAYGAVFLIAGTVLSLVGIPLWATSGTSMNME